MRNLLLRFFFWLIWKRFLKELKSVTGFKTFAAAENYAYELDCKIRKDNNLYASETITWENSCQNVHGKGRVDFVYYITIRQFIEKGEAIEKAKNQRLTNG